ncbi:hypothetical protein E1263_23285 [Kribbella antibiotica]|uniref:Uncharacterized protein n=1 Tax=Kribbella antibiotica TaxID=190195 RepID=A0A4V2YPD8_9ACTN|nr:hypothetical protein [Kribbella antibiotica]TDD57517.1 hypothetical protein E1263_23285 [Kribbella antibiotica]
MFKRLAAAVFAAPLIFTVLSVTPAHADPLLTISEITLSKALVTVSGLATEQVAVTVKGGYNSDDPADAKTTLHVFLNSQDGGMVDFMVSTELKRTAGTVKDGTWTGPLNVTSSQNSTYKAVAVAIGGYGRPFTGTPPESTQFDGPTLKVIGTHAPKLTALQVPKVVAVGKPYVIKWTVTDADTGKFYETQIRALTGIGKACSDGSAPFQPGLTSPTGTIARAYQAADAKLPHCFLLPNDPYDRAFLGYQVQRLGGVGAVPAKTSAKVGTNVPVTGSVGGPPGRCRIDLQRLYGATAWRSVNTARVRDSGRFTLTATPASQGKIPYRVLMPACNNFVASSSKPFTITGV